MGLLDKAKFWKKNEDDLGDLSDLGDFGMDSAKQDTGIGGDLGPMPSFDDMHGAGAAGMREEVQPTQVSRDMGNSLGVTPPLSGTSRPSQPTAFPQPAAQQFQPQPQQAYPAASQQPYPQPIQQAPEHPSYRQAFDLGDLAKEIEIMHAKLDAIRSSLESINQRLATLERIASPETKNRYAW
jgi:hypothetical protein